MSVARKLSVLAALVLALAAPSAALSLWLPRVLGY